MAANGSVMDDRILPATRWLSAAIVPFLLVAFVLLFVFPTRTDDLFAWTIQSPMTAMMLGSYYLAGSYAFWRAATGAKWHWVHLGFLPVTLFAGLALLATALHWDKFHHGHPAFWTWAVVYTLSPFLVFAVWVMNKGADPGTMDAVDAEVTPTMRIGAAMIGGGLALLGAAMYVLPAVMIPLWPWPLTPLTSRILGALLLVSTVGVAMSRERRWSASRIGVQTAVAMAALVLVSAARAWGEFRPDYGGTWVFVGTVVVIGALLAGAYVGMEKRSRTG